MLQLGRIGAGLARELLQAERSDPERSEQIVFIIDGHDSRRESTSLGDSVVMDADKLWRLTPYEVDTVMGRLGLTRSEVFRLVQSRVSDHLFTDTARFMADAVVAVESANDLEQRLALHGRSSEVNRPMQECPRRNPRVHPVPGFRLRCPFPIQETWYR